MILTAWEMPFLAAFAGLQNLKYTARKVCLKVRSFFTIQSLFNAGAWSTKHFEVRTRGSPNTNQQYRNIIETNQHTRRIETSAA